MARELPSIGASTYSTNTVGLNHLFGNDNIGVADPHMRRMQAAPFVQMNPQIINLKEEIVPMAQVITRMVQVFIADPDENVPLDKRLLYKGEQKLTDATDQELFFEIDIKSILDAYNADRIKIINKKVKDRTEYLEPLKIRDMKMVVVTIAGF